MKVGLIGCGGIANLHMRVFKSMSNVDVVGVCDLNEERAKETANKFKVEKFFTNYNDLFEIKDLELVDICTPIATHARIACEAAKSVPAVLVEKPMALTVSQCDEMIDTVKTHGSKLCISHQQVFLPSVEAAKALVDNGNFDLVSFTTRQKESFELLKAHRLASDWMVSLEQGGIIWEVCCHLAYLQLHFLPDIKKVFAMGAKVKYPVYDNFAVLLSTESKCFGLIDLSWVSNETDIFYEVCDSGGRRAQIYRDFDYFLENHASPPLSRSGVVRGFLDEEKRILQKWSKFGLNYIESRKMIPHFRLISNYIMSIEKDAPPPISPEDGRKTIKLLECIKKSLDDHREVVLGD